MSSPSQPGFEEKPTSRPPSSSIAPSAPPRRTSSQSVLTSKKAHRRTGSTASSIASIGGVLDTDGPGGHTSVLTPEYGQNAISTLLRPPLVRTGILSNSNAAASGFKAPTTRDIPPVTLTNIPHVDSKVFQSYLSQIGSVYDAFRMVKGEGGLDSQLFPGRGQDSSEGDLPSIVTSPPSSPRPPQEGSLTSVGTSSADTQNLSSTTAARRRSYAVTPLTSIPPIYFEEDFHLENPRTFDVVSERSEVVKDPGRHAANMGGGRKALATNAILQEKLSWYMDTVEIHLISSISKASTSFFSALGSLQELHAEAAASVDRIQSLRKDLATLDHQMARGGMAVVKLKQRRQNVRLLGQVTSQLRAIVESVAGCEELIEQGNVETALDRLDSVERLIAGRPAVRTGYFDRDHGLHDLRGTKALDGAPEDLAQLRARVGKAYESRFLATLLKDLRDHVSSVPLDVTLRRWATAFSRSRSRDRQSPVIPAYINVDGELRTELRTELTGLGRASHTMPAAAAFRASIVREVKSIIRRNMPSSNDDDGESVMSASTHGGRQHSSQEKSSLLARNLRALDGEEAQTMLANVYTAVSESLRRLSVQVKILLDITSGLSKPAESASKSRADRSSPRVPNGLLSPRSPNPRLPMITLQEDIQQVLDMSSLLGEVVDLVQGQITKVIRVRSEQTPHLSLDAFLRFFTLNRLFADECEAISGRSGASLKGTVDGQIKDFVSQSGNAQKHTVIEVMDADKWDAKDFGEAEASILNRIIDGGTRDAPAWYRTSMIWLKDDEEAVVGGVAEPLTNGRTPSPAKDRVRSAAVDGQKFILPASAVALLRTIETFQHLMTCIPSRGPDIETNLVECLKLFNSRLSQLILGAGATRSAGLKNITTKHLALAAQALSFVITLVPYIREFFRRHTSSSASNSTIEFDKVKRLYQDHQTAIHEKLIDIMGSRAALHVSSMKKVDWQEASPGKIPAVSPYVETLTRETATLQKVLSKHLPEETVATIMKPVFTSYRDQWSAAYQEVPLNSTAAKERMLADAEYFSSRISKLDGAGDLGPHIVGIVNQKTVIADGRQSEEAPKESQATVPTNPDAPVESKDAGP